MPDQGDHQAGSFAGGFTVIANILRGQGGWIDENDLAQVFQEIAFYNFVQTFVDSAPRGDPSFRQWVDAQAPLKTVLAALKPNAVLVLGLELWRHILDWPEGIAHAVIAHPASSRLRYVDAIPAFEKLVERAQAQVGAPTASVWRATSSASGAARSATSSARRSAGTPPTLT